MLTRDQQKLARAVGRSCAEVMTSPSPHLTEYGGSSGAHDRGLGEPGDWIEYNRSRVAVGPCGVLHRPKEARVMVTWAQIKAHGETLPADLVDQMRAIRREQQRHAMAAHKHWRYSHGMDLAQRWAMDAWVKAHCETLRRLSAELGLLLDRAFPLAVDDEPTDLLELLAAGGAA